MAAILASFPVWTGEWSRAQWFFVGHNFHSVFTFGTILILDFLFLISKNSSALKAQIYPKFPLMSKVIWIGLAFDFLSVGLVFREALDLTPKFFFMQTVVGILIINGVVLTGPVTRHMLKVSQEAAVMQKKWMLGAETFGTVSVASWFSITFVDFFQHLTLDYIHLLGFYTVLIGILFAAHLLGVRLWRTSV